MTDDPTAPDQSDLRHYLEVRRDADVDPALRIYCRKAYFHNYTAADKARTGKMEEYGIKDSSVIEIKFRR